MLTGLKVLHCALAVTRAHISDAQDRGGRSSESAWHFLQAVRLLRRDLSAISKLHDSSIVVAISLTIYANLNGSITESRMHLEGLKRLLELRPESLASLCSRAPEVGNKMRRADIELALLAGTPTIFGVQLFPLFKIPYLIPLHGRTSHVASSHPLNQTSPSIQAAITDVLALCSHAGSKQLSAFQYQDFLMSIVHRLIDFAPLSGQRPSNSLDDVCQLGLLAFMTTVRDHTREKRPTCSPLLSSLLRTHIERLVEEIASIRGDGHSSFHLWLIFVYAVSAPEFEQLCDPNSTVAQAVQSLASALVLETWEDFRAHLSLFPWVVVLHDEPSKKLWATIHG